MWIIAALLTAICWGLSYTAAGEVIKTTGKMQYMFLITAVNVVIYSGLFAASVKTPWSALAANKWWVLAAIVSSVAGNYLTFLAIELKGATHAAMIEITYPLWCALFSMWLLGENPLTIRSAIGAVLILAGVLLVIEH